MSYITREFKPYLEKGLSPLVDRLIYLKVHPNSITILGLFFVAGGSFLIYTENKYYGIALLVIGALMDAIDGHLARKTGLQSPFGAFLDSTVDRISDALPLIAVAVIFAKQDAYGYLLITISAILFSFLVSYTRARAEALGIKNIGGLFERTERWIVLILGLSTGFEIYAITIIAVGSAYTTLERIYYTFKQLNSGGDPDEGSGR